MKVLIVMGGFLPGKKYGGPPVSVDNFCSLLKEHSFYIITHNHDLNEEEEYPNIKTGWNDRGNCKVLYLSDDNYNKDSFEKALLEIEPNVIYLQGVFQSCVFPCLYLAKKHKIPVILAPRGELCHGALSIKKTKKQLYLFILKLLRLNVGVKFQSTSAEETEAIERIMNAHESEIFQLGNIPSIPKKDYNKLDKKAGFGRFVFLSRVHPKKNLLYAIKLFHKVKGQACLDIYGPIEDDDYWDDCQKEIAKLPPNISVNYKGLVSHENVHEVFSRYDAFLFPTLSENYGHVIVESLLVGTPVIISDQTPWRGLPSQKAGWDIPLNNPNEYVTAIDSIIDESLEEYSLRSCKTKDYGFIAADISKLKNEYQLFLNEVIANKDN